MSSIHSQDFLGDCYLSRLTTANVNHTFGRFLLFFNVNLTSLHFQKNIGYPNHTYKTQKMAKFPLQLTRIGRKVWKSGQTNFATQVCKSWKCNAFCLTFVKCVQKIQWVCVQISNTRSLLVGGFLGLWTSSFVPFGCWGRVTHAGNQKPLKIWSFWHQWISGSTFRCRDIARNLKKT